MPITLCVTCHQGNKLGLQAVLSRPPYPLLIATFFQRGSGRSHCREITEPDFDGQSLSGKAGSDEKAKERKRKDVSAEKGLCIKHHVNVISFNIYIYIYLTASGLSDNTWNLLQDADYLSVLALGS